ncbi:MAG TPA: hypothetical protein VFG42_21685 [Baekduia sp.]|uniref:hypothetical protein n=1 Tax=Baekduia sp. TaxID=2600305 RepID=UPI002D7A3998|nr:hypothetical protein [Baekduia sp.]HET6509424.1 hypothetical protein [Baekduia sp.]
MPDDRPLPDRPASRAELEAPYRHPFRHVTVQVWRAQPTLRRWTYLAPVLLAVGAAGVAAGEPLLGLLGGVGSMLSSFVVIAWLWMAVRESWRLRRSWAQRSELRAVRERRPQAGTEDPEVAHDQFAVTAEDDGWLLTWRFRPLRIGERPDEHEIEVPGRPRFAASVIADRAFDPQDAARAAEQLVAAQEAAAAKEARAASAAHGGILDAEQRAEWAQEARTTAAALRRATGQDRRR